MVQSGRSLALYGLFVLPMGNARPPVSVVRGRSSKRSGRIVIRTAAPHTYPFLHQRGVSLYRAATL